MTFKIGSSDACRDLMKYLQKFSYFFEGDMAIWNYDQLEFKKSTKLYFYMIVILAKK